MAWGRRRSRDPWRLRNGKGVAVMRMVRAVMGMGMLALAFWGSRAEALGMEVLQDRSLRVSLVACGLRDDPARAVIVVDLLDDVSRKDAVEVLATLGVAPEESALVERRVATLLFGEGGTQWKVAQEIFLNGAGDVLAATEASVDGAWSPLAPGSLPGAVWGTVRGLRERGVALAVPEGLYLPGVRRGPGVPGKTPGEDPAVVVFRDDRLYPIVREGSQYVRVELDRSEGVLWWGDAGAVGVWENMRRVGGFALEARLDDGTWTLRFEGDGWTGGVVVLPDRKHFRALEGVLRDALDRAAALRGHSIEPGGVPIVSGTLGNFAVEARLARRNVLVEEEILELAISGSGVQGVVAGNLETMRYLADHMVLAEDRWRRLEKDFRAFLETRNALKTIP